jgi:hypothetical protein
MSSTEPLLGRQPSSFIYLEPSMTEGTGRSHKLSLDVRFRITAAVFTVSRVGNRDDSSEEVVIPFPLPCLRSISTSFDKVCFSGATARKHDHLTGWCERFGATWVRMAMPRLHSGATVPAACAFRRVARVMGPERLRPSFSAPA